MQAVNVNCYITLLKWSCHVRNCTTSVDRQVGNWHVNGQYYSSAYKAWLLSILTAKKQNRVRYCSTSELAPYWKKKKYWGGFPDEYTFQVKYGGVPLISRIDSALLLTNKKTGVKFSTADRFNINAKSRPWQHMAVDRQYWSLTVAAAVYNTSRLNYVKMSVPVDSAHWLWHRPRCDISEISSTFATLIALIYQSSISRLNYYFTPFCFRQLVARYQCLYWYQIFFRFLALLRGYCPDFIVAILWGTLGFSCYVLGLLSTTTSTTTITLAKIAGLYRIVGLL